MSKKEKLLITKNDVKFYVNEEKRTVVAKIVPQISVDILDLLGEKFGCKLWGITNPSQRVGIARSNPTDKWDEHIGKRVALLKLNKHIVGAIMTYLYKQIFERNIKYDELLWNWENITSELKGRGENNNGSQANHDSKADAE